MVSACVLIHVPIMKNMILSTHLEDFPLAGFVIKWLQTKIQVFGDRMVNSE